MRTSRRTLRLKRGCAPRFAVKSGSIPPRARYTPPTLPTTASFPSGLFCRAMLRTSIAAVAACREFGAAVLSRGGGTSIPGQCCNVAVILDFSKYMRRIVSMDYEGRRARVEPGIVLDTLRAEAERGQLTFAPDPATHNRCTIGGMIGNNSCGVHALMGGKTVDNIESLDVLLYDGTRMTLGPMSEDALEAAIAAGGRAGAIYAGLKRIRDTYASLVRERSRTFRAASPATTSTSCCRRTAFTSRARWLDRRPHASRCWKRKCG